MHQIKHEGPAAVVPLEVGEQQKVPYTILHNEILKSSLHYLGTEITEEH